MPPRAIFLLFLSLQTVFLCRPAAADGTGNASCSRGPVTVIAASGDRATSCQVADRAMWLHERIRRDLDLRHTVEVSIVLATPDLAPQALPLDPQSLPPWLAAVALSGQQVIVIRMLPGRTSSDLESLLAHELTHVILKEDYPSSAAWPRWFQEGLAMQQSRGEGLRLHASLSFAAARGRLIPLDSLWAAFPSDQAGSRVAYAQSFSILSFLMSRHGEALFAQFMDGLRSGDFAATFSLVYGYGLGRMEKQWQRFVKLRYSWIPLATGGTAFWALSVSLFFIALGARRRRSRELHRQWEEEERQESQ